MLKNMEDSRHLYLKSVLVSNKNMGLCLNIHTKAIKHPECELVYVHICLRTL